MLTLSEFRGLYAPFGSFVLSLLSFSFNLTTKIGLSWGTGDFLWQS